MAIHGHRHHRRQGLFNGFFPKNPFDNNQNGRGRPNTGPPPPPPGGRGNDQNTNNKKDAITIIRTKFETLTPTFDDEIGGFMTFPPDDDPSETGAVGPAVTGEPSDTEDSDSLPTTLAIADPLTTTPAAKATTGDLLPAATGPATTTTTSSEGVSGSAKAGIAIGVLGAALLIFGIVYLAFARRRKRAERQSLDDDEKIHGPFAPSDVPPQAPPKAPRISLRPVTQFLPTLNFDKRFSRGGFLGPGAAAGAAGAVHHGSRAQGGSAWERPITSQSNNPANPFGNQAERVPTPVSEERNAAGQMPVSPVEDSRRHPSPVSPVSPLESTSAGVFPAPPGGQMQDPLTASGPAVGAIGLARSNSRTDGPQHLDLTLSTPLSAIPPSPAGTEFSVNSVAPGQQMSPSASAAAIAAAGGPVGSTVHRVQLDFKPSLEDELELKAGQLVRLLHEYDDGWALCIRLDRSQQGVVPRTCLSTRPVKPRPQNGPRGAPAHPSGRPMTPQGHGPKQIRSQSPARPSTAPGHRQTSPNQRSQSPSGASRRASPTGNGPVKASGGSPPQQYAQVHENHAQQQRRGPPTGPVGRKPLPGVAY